MTNVVPVSNIMMSMSCWWCWSECTYRPSE